jgi:hypothetical protein
MKILCYSEITDGGQTDFRSVAKLEDDHLIVTFEGDIRVENPYRYLSSYLDELAKVVPQQQISSTTLDFVKLNYCNSQGFYVLMDITDVVYKMVPGKVTVLRVTDDDWQHETLPILLNVREAEIAERTSFQDVRP